MFYASSVYDNNFSSFVCLSLFSAMSSRVFLFFPPRGRKSSLTLRDHLNLHRCLQRHRVAVPRYAKRPSVALYTIDILFLFPSPPSLHCILKKFPNTIWLGNRPPLNWISVSTHKSIFVRRVVSMLSQPVNKTSHNRYSPQGLLVIMLYCIHAVVLL